MVFWGPKNENSGQAHPDRQGHKELQREEAKSLYTEGPGQGRAAGEPWGSKQPKASYKPLEPRQGEPRQPNKP